MLQETPTQWNMDSVDRFPPPDEKFFVLAIVVVIIAVTVKLVRVWLLAPPLRRTLPSNPPKYRRRLELSVSALLQWLWLPLFFWLFISTHRLYDLFGGLESTKFIPISATMGDLRDLARYFSFALSATAYAFLVRWNLITRLTRLRD
jgi:hypothetical protein